VPTSGNAAFDMASLSLEHVADAEPSSHTPKNRGRPYAWCQICRCDSSLLACRVTMERDAEVSGSIGQSGHRRGWEAALSQQPTAHCPAHEKIAQPRREALRSTQKIINKWIVRWRKSRACRNAEDPPSSWTADAKGTSLGVSFLPVQQMAWLRLSDAALLQNSWPRPSAPARAR